MRQAIRRLLSTGLLAVAAWLLLNFFDENFRSFLQEHHWDNFLNQIWSYVSSLVPSDPATILRVWWFWLVLGFAAGVAVTLWVLKLAASFFAGTRIAITSPPDGATVLLRAPVSGTVSPPEIPVQVLVHSGDYRWHPQRPAVTDGGSWTVDCQFGTQWRGAGETYKVVAIDGAHSVNNPVRSLPDEAIRSRIISVKRAA
jgi:hypothetical protein